MPRDDTFDAARTINAMLRAVGCDDPQQATPKQVEQVARAIIAAAKEAGISPAAIAAQLRKMMIRH